MTNLFQLLTGRFSATTFVLPVIVGLTVITYHLNPKAPEPYREIVLDLTAQKQVCELHGLMLQPDVVPTECLSDSISSKMGTPNAHECWGTGVRMCGNSDNTWAKAGYCSSCRSTQRWQRLKWMMKLTWRNLFS